MNGIPLLPAVTVEFVGSALAIFFSFLALRYAWSLVRLQPSNFIWGFLFYFCIAMAAFSLSRGVGHMVRIILVYSDQSDLWKQLSPISGGFNTMLMISVAAVIIYYHKGLAAYKLIRKEAVKLFNANTQLASSADQLKELNIHLEEMVEIRTRNLSESEKKFRNFFENSKDIIYFCDKNGTITNINNSGINLLGFDVPFQQVNFHDLFTDRKDLDAYLLSLRKNGFISDFEIECTGTNKATKHILLTANAIYDKNGHFIGCEGIGKDMTRLRNMTEQLINQEKMASVGQMAAGVAHEINTPLGIILGYTQLMMDDFEEESEAHSSLLVMERQTKACRRIVADLLKFSRQADSAKTSIDINTIIGEVLAVTEHTLNINQVDIIRNFCEELPQVVGDAEKLHQVFINLFNNAQFAMVNGGKIFITTKQLGSEVLITVQDTGTGIPNDIKNKIFDPFFTTKDVGKGTGLGLSVTYGIIKDHGGRITVESPVIDLNSTVTVQGTAFHIWLPTKAILSDDDREQH
ncbi:MAG: PAS domain-containing sensor histidine kinase [Desulfotalea sp.]|nr:MAG: PAS domain-containing sensor histidine kinase [Desulfotalea sp.]